MTETAILGFGTVGSGVAELVDRNGDRIRESVPGGIHVKYILDLRDFPDSPYADRVVHDIEEILEDPDIRIICETMGGKEPAFTFTRRALERGISVCTSNKELVAAHGPELAAIARAHSCSYLFEASVGGGIPLLRTLSVSLSQERIDSVVGILNGTTNYILTKMERFGSDFDAVLREAQEMGYAERNPEADVEAHDTGRKIAILSSLITGRNVSYEQMYCEGITKITPADIAAARAAGCVVRLLGVSEARGDGSYTVFAAPFAVPDSSPLAMVSDVFNGVLLHGNMVGDVMLYGQGAGKYPTASAVVSDVIDLAQHQGSWIPVRWKTDEETELAPLAERKGAFLVRTDAGDRETAVRLFGRGIRALESSPEEFAFLTGMMTEQEFDEKAGQLPSMRSRLRVLA